LIKIGFKNVSFLIVLWLLVGEAKAQIQDSCLPEKLVQQQLDAYNNRDLEAFIFPFANDVKIYEFPNSLMFSNLEEMGSQYGRMFARTPDLHAHLVNRIVNGNTVIDHEEVTLHPNEPKLKIVAIYKIKGDKISEVYFIYNNTDQ
jgi:hypothetical protein